MLLSTNFGWPENQANKDTYQFEKQTCFKIISPTWYIDTLAVGDLWPSESNFIQSIEDSRRQTLRR